MSLHALHEPNQFYLPASLDENMPKISVSTFIGSSKGGFLDGGFGGAKVGDVGFGEVAPVHLNELGFLDASTHLYKRVCPSVGRWVSRFFQIAEIDKSDKSNKHAILTESYKSLCNSC